jgi:ketosteroid isomerase-like protein
VTGFTKQPERAVILAHRMSVMSAEDVAVLRRAYEALNRGDAAEALSALDPGAEWQEHSTLPEAGSYSGRDAIERFLHGFMESWDRFHQNLERVEAAGDKVFLFLHVQAVGKGSGIEVEGSYAHVWTMRDGRGMRVDAYEDPEQAIALLEREREAVNR